MRCMTHISPYIIYSLLGQRTLAPARVEKTVRRAEKHSALTLHSVQRNPYHVFFGGFGMSPGHNTQVSHWPPIHGR